VYVACGMSVIDYTAIRLLSLEKLKEFTNVCRHIYMKHLIVGCNRKIVVLFWKRLVTLDGKLQLV